MHASQVKQFLFFIGFTTSTQTESVLVFAFDKPIEKLVACARSFQFQVYHLQTEDKIRHANQNRHISSYKTF